MSFEAGILGCEVYVPKLFIQQSELEDYDEKQEWLAREEGSEGSSRSSSVGSSSASFLGWKGKYTKGLGQTRMSFVSDREDVCSLALTVVSRLLNTWSIDKSTVGVIYVARETIFDHSKSIKSVIMQLFSKNPSEISDAGSHHDGLDHSDIGGCDMLHACYSGTEALTSCVNWSETRSESSKRKYAIMVCADIAEYCTRATRPAGGAGAVAFLIGKEFNGFKPFLTLSRIRGSYSAHGYDFYKPSLASPYPTVDGKVSNHYYLRSLDECYQCFNSQYESEEQSGFRVSDLDYYVFHSPYNKLVEKSFARLIYNDFWRNPNDDKYHGMRSEMKRFKDVNPRSNESTQSELVRAFQKWSEPEYKAKVLKSTVLSKEVGNCYTASLWMGLVSLLAADEDCILSDRKIGCFSYGSGICSSLFVLNVCDSDENRNLIKARSIARQRISEVTKDGRKKICVEDYCTLMRLRERMHNQISVGLSEDFDGICNPRETVTKGAYYLESVDTKGRRKYAVQTEDVIADLDNSLGLIHSWFHSQNNVAIHRSIPATVSVFEKQGKIAMINQNRGRQLGSHLLFASMGVALGLFIGLSVSKYTTMNTNNDRSTAE